MNSMLPIITMSELQRNAKDALGSVKDYAVVQSHGRDRAFVLEPGLGRLLLESGMLEKLRAMRSADTPDVETQLRGLIGNVLRELSKR